MVSFLASPSERVYPEGSLGFPDFGTGKMVPSGEVAGQVALLLPQDQQAHRRVVVVVQLQPLHFANVVNSGQARVSKQCKELEYNSPVNEQLVSSHMNINEHTKCEASLAQWQLLLHLTDHVSVREDGASPS